MITVSYNYHSMTYFVDVSQKNIISSVPFGYNIYNGSLSRINWIFMCSIPIPLNIFLRVFLSSVSSLRYNFGTIFPRFLQYAQIYFNYILSPYFFRARPNAINNILPGDKLIEVSPRFCSYRKRRQPNIFTEMFGN